MWFGGVAAKPETTPLHEGPLNSDRQTFPGIQNSCQDSQFGSALEELDLVGGKTQRTEPGFWRILETHLNNGGKPRKVMKSLGVRCFSCEVWGFPTVGIAHGRTAEVAGSGGDQCDQFQTSNGVFLGNGSGSVAIGIFIALEM